MNSTTRDVRSRAEDDCESNQDGESQNDTRPSEFYRRKDGCGAGDRHREVCAATVAIVQFSSYFVTASGTIHRTSSWGNFTTSNPDGHFSPSAYSACSA